MNSNERIKVIVSISYAQLSGTLHLRQPHRVCHAQRSGNRSGHRQCGLYRHSLWSIARKTARTCQILGTRVGNGNSHSALAVHRLACETDNSPLCYVCHGPFFRAKRSRSCAGNRRTCSDDQSCAGDASSSRIAARIFQAHRQARCTFDHPCSDLFDGHHLLNRLGHHCDWYGEQSDHYDFGNRLGSLGDDDLCGSSFQSHRASSNSQDTRAFIPRADRRCTDSGICSCLISKGCDLFHDGVLAGDRNDQSESAGESQRSHINFPGRKKPPANAEGLTFKFSAGIPLESCTPAAK